MCKKPLISCAAEFWLHWKKKIKFFLIYKEIKRDRGSYNIRPKASSYMGKYLRISSYIRKPFLIYDFAPDPILISIYVRKFCFLFLSVCQLQLQYDRQGWETRDGSVSCECIQFASPNDHLNVTALNMFFAIMYRFCACSPVIMCYKKWWIVCG